MTVRAQIYNSDALTEAYTDIAGIYRNMQGLDFETALPGGFTVATMTTLIPNLEANNVELGSVLVCKEGQDIVFQGHIEDMQYQAAEGAYALRLSAYGAWYRLGLETITQTFNTAITGASIIQAALDLGEDISSDYSLISETGINIDTIAFGNASLASVITEVIRYGRYDGVYGDFSTLVMPTQFTQLTSGGGTITLTGSTCDMSGSSAASAAEMLFYNQPLPVDGIYSLSTRLKAAAIGSSVMNPFVFATSYTDALPAINTPGTPIQFQAEIEYSSGDLIFSYLESTGASRTYWNGTAWTTTRSDATTTPALGDYVEFDFSGSLSGWKLDLYSSATASAPVLLTSTASVAWDSTYTGASNCWMWFCDPYTANVAARLQYDYIIISEADEYEGPVYFAIWGTPKFSSDNTAPRAVLARRNLANVDWRVRVEEIGLQWTRTLDNVYNAVDIVFAGSLTTGESTDTTSIARYGRRKLVAEVDTQSENAAVVMRDIFLESHKDPVPSISPFTVKGKCRDGGGAWRECSRIKAGDVMTIEDWLDGYTFMIGHTRYNWSDNSIEVTPETIPQSLELQT
ncbi:MAG: hypothetical protein M0R06_01240 [Sphaerochaeta sp.]|jgi:hypothetical protein|nr:hypothetical protein [Sphaerochaeta sp.]